MIKKILAHPLLLLPVITLVLYWPISMGLFTFKNDALTYYYPIRTLISDALNNGELPLWTPFINLGYPLHADFQSGAWNPVIWIIALLTNYPLAAFHAEFLLYLSIGSIGCYYLSMDHHQHKATSLLIATSYLASGPLLDSLQFTACISAAAYIPFAWLFARKIIRLHKPALNAALLAFVMYLLFTGGYPALFIISVYLLGVLFLFSWLATTRKRLFIRSLLPPLGFCVLVFCLLSLPAIVAFAQHLPLIERGQQQGLAFVLENSMPPASMFSLLSPFSTTATHPLLDTDPLMRNAYMGLVPLVLLVAGIVSKNRRHRQAGWYCFTALLLFGLAWGSFFFLRQLAYYTLPLMDTFRHAALFRYFAVLLLLMASGYYINAWRQQPMQQRKFTRRIILVIAIALSIAGLFSHGALADLLAVPPDATQAKLRFTGLGFQQRFLLQLPFILITLALLYRIVGLQKPTRWLLLLSAADLFVATQFNLPVTGIGARSFANSERLMNRNPHPFPLPGISTLYQNGVNSRDTTIGSKLPYEKRIGRNEFYITPGNLASQEALYESPLRETIYNNPPLYLADTLVNYPATLRPLHFPARTAFVESSLPVVHTTGDTAFITKMSANAFTCSIRVLTPRVLVLLQNNYPGWKVLIDGNEGNIFTVNTSFIGVTVPAGTQEVKFIFRPEKVIIAWYVSLATLLAVMAGLLMHWFGRFRFLKRHQQ